MAEKIIRLSYETDDYRWGFVGSMQDEDGHWSYLEDIGIHSHQWWRRYARTNGYVLREVRR